MYGLWTTEELWLTRNSDKELAGGSVSGLISEGVGDLSDTNLEDIAGSKVLIHVDDSGRIVDGRRLDPRNGGLGDANADKDGDVSWAVLDDWCDQILTDWIKNKLKKKHVRSCTCGILSFLV